MKLIMFDYDGVLMDTFEFTRRVYKDLSDEFNLNLPSNPDFLREIIELDWTVTLKKLNLTTKEQIKKDDQIFRNGFVKYSDTIKPYPGMEHVLSVLSKKYILAVVTNNFRQEVTSRLKKFGLDNYFSGFFTCEDGYVKPHPDLINKCLKRFKIEPIEAAYIGDMDGDIICGRAAKVGRVVAVEYGYHLKHRLKDADNLIKKPEDLLELF